MYVQRDAATLTNQYGGLSGYQLKAPHDMAMHLEGNRKPTIQ